MVRKSWLLLTLILLLGLIIRIIKIDALPLYGDELTMVYDTYSISKTGMDSTGAKLPLTFRMGAGRPGGYIYFSLPFVAIFGPSVWGERLLSLLSGLGIITLMYFLGRKLFSEKVGIIASFLLAISPWDIYLSRGGFEAHFALFLALLGMTAFIYKKYIWFGISWGLAILTYPTFKLTLPLLFIILVLLQDFRKLIKEKSFIVALTILLGFGVVTGFQTFTSGSEQRFLSENILADKNTNAMIVQRVNYERTVSTLPTFIKPVFINSEIEYGRDLFENYIANISPNFLVLRGDGNPRHNPGEMGMLFLVDLPLILIGLILLYKSQKKEFNLLLSWIVITPLATMFFPEAHALRNGLMLPPLLLIAAYTLTRVPKKMAYLLAAFMLIQLAYLLVRIYTIAPTKFASFWSSEARDNTLKAIEATKNGQKVTFLTNKIDNIEYAYEVYAKVDPKLVISQYGKLPKTFGLVTIADK